MSKLYLIMQDTEIHMAWIEEVRFRSEGCHMQRD